MTRFLEIKSFLGLMKVLKRKKIHHTIKKSKRKTNKNAKPIFP